MTQVACNTYDKTTQLNYCGTLFSKFDQTFGNASTEQHALPAHNTVMTNTHYTKPFFVTRKQTPLSKAKQLARGNKNTRKNALSLHKTPQRPPSKTHAISNQKCLLATLLVVFVNSVQIPCTVLVTDKRTKRQKPNTFCFHIPLQIICWLLFRFCEFSFHSCCCCCCCFIGGGFGFGYCF